MFKANVIGRLGRDAILKEVGEKTYVSFTAAVDTFRNSEETTWVEVMYRTNATGVTNYLKKGRQVYISGTPKFGINDYDGKQSVKVTIWCDELELLGSLPQSN